VTIVRIEQVELAALGWFVIDGLAVDSDTLGATPGLDGKLGKQALNTSPSVNPSPVLLGLLLHDSTQIQPRKHGDLDGLVEAETSMPHESHALKNSF
jgi:hypothetical protein